MAKENVFENIARLAPARRRGKLSKIAIFDATEGAGQQSRQVTPKEFLDMAATYQNVKGHEVGNDNQHTGPNSVAYGDDLVTGIPERPFTCTANSTSLVVAGIDVTDDFRTGDVVRIYYGDNTLYVERIVQTSTFGTDTTIVVDVAPPNILSGIIVNHGHGAGCVNAGFNNHIKGDFSIAVGSGLRILRDVVGAILTGSRNTAAHSGVVGSGQDGYSHWTGEHYISSPMTAVAGDTKSSIVPMKVLTTDATPASLLCHDGRKLILPDGFSGYFEVRATGTQTGGSSGTAKDTYVVHIRGAVKNIGGAITIIDQEEVYTAADGAMAGTLTVAEDDTNAALDLIAAGQANKDITWTAEVKLVFNIAS